MIIRNLQLKFSCLRNDVSRIVYMLAILLMSPHAFAEKITIHGHLCTLVTEIAGKKVDIYSTTNEPLLDRQLALEANRLADVFEVRPGLKIARNFFNAAATSDTIVKNTWGTVLMGQELITKFLNDNRRNAGGLTVAGFMAHEFAHIYQFSSGFRDKLMKGQSTVKLQELHADFLAGYYLGVKRRQTQADWDIGAFTEGIYLVGDSNIEDYNHHGKSKERRAAVLLGYKTGIQKGVQPMSTIAEIGLHEVRKL